jgi:cytochrome c551/c552
MHRWLLILAGATLSAPAFSAVGDAERGKQVFESLKCAMCHSVAGLGGTTAPDLALRQSRGNSPADLAASMWTHAPQMWAAMDKAGVAKPKLNTEQAADLFAWFQAGRYFENSGDAARGRRTFESKGCSGCHALPGQPKSVGPALSQWQSVSDPIELARQMWNHAPAMQAAVAAKGGKMPELTAAEMNDIITYVSSLPNNKGRQGQFSPGPADTGQTLLEVKGCNSCHKGAQALPGKTRYTTSAEIAAAMWNHAARMKNSGQLRPEEMRRIVGYLWSRQFESEGGDAARGEKLFSQKACAGCHGSSAPYLGHGEESSSYGMVAVLWYHGPDMLRQMKTKNVAWPQFTGGEISDVIAFLKASK